MAMCSSGIPSSARFQAIYKLSCPHACAVEEVKAVKAVNAPSPDKPHSKQVRKITPKAPDRFHRLESEVRTHGKY